MPAATSPLPATAVRGVNVRQRLPVISRLTRSFRIFGPSEWASLFTRIKAKLLMVGPDGLDMPAARRQIPLRQQIEAVPLCVASSGGAPRSEHRGPPHFCSLLVRITLP